MARVKVSRKNESESAAANKSRSNNMKVPFGEAEYWNVQIYSIIMLQLSDKLPADEGNHVCLLLFLFFSTSSLVHKDFIISQKNSGEKRSVQFDRIIASMNHKTNSYNDWLYYLITLILKMFAKMKKKDQYSTVFSPSTVWTYSLKQKCILCFF